MTRCDIASIGAFSDRCMSSTYRAMSGSASFAATTLRCSGSFCIKTAIQVPARSLLSVLVTVERIASGSSRAPASWLVTSARASSPYRGRGRRMSVRIEVTSVNVSSTPPTEPLAASSGTASAWTQTSDPSGRVQRATIPRSGCRLRMAASAGWRFSASGHPAASVRNQPASAAFEPAISPAEAKPRIWSAARLALVTRPWPS